MILEHTKYLKKAKVVTGNAHKNTFQIMWKKLRVVLISRKNWADVVMGWEICGQASMTFMAVSEVSYSLKLTTIELVIQGQY